MKWRSVIVSVMFVLAAIKVAEAAPLFESNEWIGFANVDGTGCIMVAPLPDKKTAIAVEILDPEDIAIGVRWVGEDYSSFIGQEIVGKLFIDNSPPITLKGTFPQKDYLRFSSESRGLLMHSLTTGRSMRLEYGDGGWISTGLRGSTKAIKKLAECSERQRTAALFSGKAAENPTAGGPEATASGSKLATFKSTAKSLINEQSYLSISLGDIVSKDKLSAVFPGTSIEYQMYAEDGECPDGCYFISSNEKGSLSVSVKVDAKGNITSITFSGPAASDPNGNKTGQLFSEIASLGEIQCDFGYYSECMNPSGNINYLEPEVLCEHGEAFVDATSGLASVKRRDCLRIKEFHLGSF